MDQLGLGQEPYDGEGLHLIPFTEGCQYTMQSRHRIDHVPFQVVMRRPLVSMFIIPLRPDTGKWATYLSHTPWEAACTNLMRVEALNVV